jgi:hypothetical protein
MAEDGNQALVRVIADQMFDIWEARQGKRRASWPAWLGVGLSIVGIVFAAGSLRSDVASANTRIDKLEQRADLQDRTAGQVNDRLARIETKLDLALEERKR